MIQLDKNTLEYFREKGSEKIKIYFYDAGCSGMKVDITDDFEVNGDLVEIPLPLGLREGVRGWVMKTDKEKLENSTITRTVKADHTGKEKVRYIFSSQQVKDRCGCGSSFNFDGKKKPKINIEKLRELKKQFR